MAQYAANEIENMPDSPVAREDLGAGGIPRGAGARSPLFLWLPAASAATPAPAASAATPSPICFPFPIVTTTFPVML